MKLCFIAQGFEANRGGNEVFSNLFKSLGDSYDITVITDRGHKIPTSWKTETVSSRSYTYLYSVSNFLFARAAVARFYKLHSETPFDCVVVNQVIGKPILKLELSGIPVVYVVHHPVSVDRALAIQESGFFAALKWHVVYWGMKSTQAKIVKKISHVLTVSQTSRDRIVQDYGVSAQKIHVIHNGIDTNFFRKTVPTQPHTVVAVGSYQHPRRGFTYLEKAYRRLSAAGFSIFDVGRRWPYQDEELKQIPGLRIYESVDSAQLPELYSNASVMISTALFEGFGLSLVEALACETPAVAFAGGGVGEVLSMIDSSLVCPARDVEALVARAIAAAQDPERVQKGQLYRQRVIEHFSLEKMVRAYDQYFQSLIQ